MDIIEKNTVNHIYCNISNEVENAFYTMTIEAAEYSVNVALETPEGVNDRYVAFALIEGTEDLLNATIELPNNGDYPYKIMNTTTLAGTDGIEIHRGILRLKQPKEIVYSYTNEQNTIIYE
jgi:hypothetical protein|tara:strand:+ start:717 stop:1079 length:363 start_codon:yes stop_codon:yes gene_type:complete